ncbi:GDP-D-mannose dehydratase [Bradyrhizobium diazoefficiens]
MQAQDKKRVALITGVTGQDGAYLAEYLARARLYGAWH